MRGRERERETEGWSLDGSVTVEHGFKVCVCGVQKIEREKGREGKREIENEREKERDRERERERAMEYKRN